MHRGMLLLLTLAGPMAVVPHRAIASEVDREKELLDEAVEVKEYKMVIEEFGLLSIPSARGNHAAETLLRGPGCRTRQQGQLRRHHGDAPDDLRP